MFCHLDGSRSFHAPFFLVVYVSTDNSFLNNLKTICFCKANNEHVEFAHLPLFQVFLNFYQQASKAGCRTVSNNGSGSGLAPAQNILAVQVWFGFT